MVLNTVVKAVKRKSHRGNQAVTTDQITTDIVACVNEAIRDVVKLIPKRYLHDSDSISITAGVAGTPSTWTLESAVQDLIIAHYTLNNVYYTLNKILSDEEWFRSIWNPTTPTNNPRYFREIGLDANRDKQIELFPIPVAAFTLKYEYYKKRTSDLSTSDLSSEVPILPDEYQDAIEKGAFYYFLKGFDDPGQGIAKGDYEEAKLALEIGDERNSAGQLSLRLTRPSYQLPGFRL